MFIVLERPEVPHSFRSAMFRASTVDKNAGRIENGDSTSTSHS